MKKFSTNLIVVLASIFFSMISIEIAYKSYNFYRFNIRKAKIEKKENTSCNEPYINKNSCYKDQDNLSKMYFTTLNGYKPFPNYEGNGYINDQFGFRKGEIDKPSPDSKAVVFSGGSTAWGAGVKTKDVYSSILNRSISKYGYYTVNAAVGGYTISQELNRIINDVIEIPNLTHLIMFSGWNDIYAGYKGYDYYLSPDMFTQWRKFMSTKPKGFMLTKNQQKIIDTTNPNFSKLITIRTFQKLNYFLSQDKNSNKEIKKLSPNELVNLIVLRVEIAYAIAKARDINFVFALQPSIYSTRKNLTTFEGNLLAKRKISNPDLQPYFSSVYPKLRKKLQQSSKNNGYIFMDLDAAISSETDTVFADHVHFGDRGNKLIAKFFLDNLKSIIFNLSSVIK